MDLGEVERMVRGSEPEPATSTHKWNSPAYDVLNKHNLLRDDFQVESCENMAWENACSVALPLNGCQMNTSSTYGMRHTACRRRSTSALR